MHMRATKTFRHDGEEVIVTEVPSSELLNFSEKYSYHVAVIGDSTFGELQECQSRRRST